MSDDDEPSIAFSKQKGGPAVGGPAANNNTMPYAAVPQPGPVAPLAAAPLPARAPLPPQRAAFSENSPALTEIQEGGPLGRGGEAGDVVSPEGTAAPHRRSASGHRPTHRSSSSGQQREHSTSRSASAAVPPVPCSVTEQRKMMLRKRIAAAHTEREVLETEEAMLDAYLDTASTNPEGCLSSILLGCHSNHNTNTNGSSSEDKAAAPSPIDTFERQMINLSQLLHERDQLKARAAALEATALQESSAFGDDTLARQRLLFDLVSFLAADLAFMPPPPQQEDYSNSPKHRGRGASPPGPHQQEEQSSSPFFLSTAHTASLRLLLKTIPVLAGATHEVTARNQRHARLIQAELGASAASGGGMGERNKAKATVSTQCSPPHRITRKEHRTRVPVNKSNTGASSITPRDDADPAAVVASPRRTQSITTSAPLHTNTRAAHKTAAPPPPHEVDLSSAALAEADAPAQPSADSTNLTSATHDERDERGAVDTQPSSAPLASQRPLRLIGAPSVSPSTSAPTGTGPERDAAEPLVQKATARASPVVRPAAVHHVRSQGRQDAIIRALQPPPRRASAGEQRSARHNSATGSASGPHSPHDQKKKKSTTGTTSGPGPAAKMSPSTADSSSPPPATPTRQPHAPSAVDPSSSGLQSSALASPQPKAPQTTASSDRDQRDRLVCVPLTATRAPSIRHLLRVRSQSPRSSSSQPVA